VNEKFTPCDEVLVKTVGDGFPCVSLHYITIDAMPIAKRIAMLCNGSLLTADAAQGPGQWFDFDC
jgi:hypothetical protein